MCLKVGLKNGYMEIKDRFLGDYESELRARNLVMEILIKKDAKRYDDLLLKLKYLERLNRKYGVYMSGLYEDSYTKDCCDKYRNDMEHYYAAAKISSDIALFLS